MRCSVETPPTLGLTLSTSTATASVSLASDNVEVQARTVVYEHRCRLSEHVQHSRHCRKAA
jgi:hypothetical protein